MDMHYIIKFGSKTCVCVCVCVCGGGTWEVEVVQG